MKHYSKYLVGIALVTGAFLLISWRRRGLNAAIDYINVQEIGNNQGWGNKEFQKMMQDVGWSSGESWCMYFVKAIMLAAYPGKAGKIKTVLNPSTQKSWANAKTSDVFKVITEGNPKPGDIIIWQSTKNASLGHTGIVWKHDEGTNYTTVEGNSSFDGAREGQGVVRGHRNLKIGTVQGTLKVLGFLRLKL